MKLDPVKLSLVDRAVNYFNPTRGLERIRAKAAIHTLQASGYVTAGSRKRSMRSWNPKAGTADEDILPSLADLRASSRDLFKNSPMAAGAIKRVRTNAVGSGLTLQSIIDNDALNMSVEAAEAWEKSVEREFNLWAHSELSDASRTQNFFQMQGLVLFNQCLSGEVFVATPMIENNQLPYQLALKVIEADLISNPNLTLDTATLAAGIEINDDGAPIAYHIKKQPFGGVSMPTWNRVVARGEESGRKNILHVFDKERPGQRRGIPLLAPVIEPLKQITRLSEAELMASVVTSFFTVFVKTEQDAGLAQGYVPPETALPTDADGEPTETVDKPIYEMGNGSIIELGENESIELADPKRPSGNFDPFFMSIVKQIGSALEIPFEQLMLHFQASYSAARAALLEAWKFYRMRRQWLAWQFCQPVYELFLEEIIATGRISAPGFFNDPLIRSYWTGSLWIGPGQGQIDPLKETRASMLKIKGRLTSYSREFGQAEGGSWEREVSRLSRDVATLEANKFKEAFEEDDTSVRNATDEVTIADS